MSQRYNTISKLLGHQENRSRLFPRGDHITHNPIRLAILSPRALIWVEPRAESVLVWVHPSPRRLKVFPVGSSRLDTAP